mmetsp:Transcript_111594/g.296593  ORF Transcript_111594/g.296593 Transcript_111594/m.296593 type:complete len:200 (+) Transcript_111594:25-624(+)
MHQMSDAAHLPPVPSTDVRPPARQTSAGRRPCQGCGLRSAGGAAAATPAAGGRRPSGRGPAARPQTSSPGGPPLARSRLRNAAAPRQATSSSPPAVPRCHPEREAQRTRGRTMRSPHRARPIACGRWSSGRWTRPEDLRAPSAPPRHRSRRPPCTARRWRRGRRPRVAPPTRRRRARAARRPRRRRVPTPPRRGSGWAR